MKQKKMWIETYERQIKHFEEREQHFLEEAEAKICVAEGTVSWLCEKYER